MKKYDTYKDSGIQWIGQIPAGWKTSKLKYISKFINGFAFASNLFSPDEGCKVIRIGDICQTIDYNSCIRAKIDASVIGQYRIHENDVLVAMSGATTGKSCLVNSIEEAYINQRVGIIRSPSYKFIHYMLNTPFFYQYIMLNNAGSAQPNISSTAIEDYKIPLPPLSEQQAIVQFLDKKTGQIDQSIALLETQKTDLQAYRQALITETVTKGLNPNAPMKDSGIQWIGEIPEGWCITKIKYLANTQENSFIDGDWIESPYVTDMGIRYLTSGNIGNGVFKRQGNGYITEDTFQKLNCKYAYPGDLVFCRLNQPFGRSCILPDEQDRYVLAVDNVILRTNEDKRYICYLTQLERYQNYIGMLANGTAMQRISRTKLGNVNVPLPPLFEQKAIADYLDKKTSDIDAALKQIDTQIADLQAYRTALISEAVTGKIDVR